MFVDYHFRKLSFNVQVYVQDLLHQNAEEVCNFLTNQNSHFYVCGDVTMASDVTKSLESILQNHSAFSLAESQALIAEMKVSK